MDVRGGVPPCQRGRKHLTVVEPDLDVLLLFQAVGCGEQHTVRRLHQATRRGTAPRFDTHETGVQSLNGCRESIGELEKGGAHHVCSSV